MKLRKIWAGTFLFMFLSSCSKEEQLQHIRAEIDEIREGPCFQFLIKPLDEVGETYLYDEIPESLKEDGPGS